MAASRMLKEAAARGEDIRNVALPPTAEEDDDRCVLGCVLVQVTNRVLSPRKSFGCVNVARHWLGCACWDQRKKELRPWCQSLEGMMGGGRVSPCVLTFDLGSFDVACCCSSLQGALPLLRPQVRPAHSRPPHPTLQEHQGQAKHAQGRRGRAGAAQALRKWVMRSGMLSSTVAKQDVHQSVLQGTVAWPLCSAVGAVGNVRTCNSEAVGTKGMPLRRSTRGQSTSRFRHPQQKQ